MCFIILSAHTSGIQYEMLENVPYLSVYMLSWTKLSVTLQKCDSSPSLSPTTPSPFFPAAQNYFPGYKKALGRLSQMDHSLSEKCHLRDAKSHLSFNLSCFLALQGWLLYRGRGQCLLHQRRDWCGAVAGGGSGGVGGVLLVPFLGIKAEGRIQRGLPISRSGGMWVT